MAMSRLEGWRSLTTCPSMRTSPEVTDSSPAMVLSRVDLPQPDGPTSTRKPPFSSVRSMPFSTSTEPNRLLSDLISSVAIPLSLDRAGHQAADEIAAADHIDEQRGYGGDDRGRHVDVVLDDAGRGVDPVVQRHRNRRGVPGGEGRAEQEIVPDVGELVDDRDDDDRPGARQHDPPEDLEEAGTVHHGGLD